MGGMNESPDTGPIYDKVWTLWPSVRDVSEDLNESYSTTYRRFRARNLPPAYCDVQVIERAEKLGVDLTYEQLARYRAANEKREK